MAFHLWTISEAYSNVDGSVQFIELFTTSPGETQIAGHTITFTPTGGSAVNFVVPGNLSSSTATKSLLFATQGYADLGLVTPDFIIPDGFLSTTGGTLNVFGVDSLTFSSLPTGGTLSINGSGTSGINSPTNFAGASGSIPGNPIVGSASADTLIGTAGNDFMVGLGSNDSLSGAGGADTLIGGTGSDRLNGGTGADAMRGGAGNDIYTAGAGDTILELAGQGTDLVLATVSHVLSGQVEKLILAGASNINGMGNTLANTITGNSAINVLTGAGRNDVLIGQGGNDVLRGGVGNDRLTGGTGADKFDFNSVLNAGTNVDRITDFSAGIDDIRLDDDIFTALAAGALDPSGFHSVPGATDAHDATDRIIYDSASGNLYYDADGNGAVSSAVLFATLVTHPAITAADFFIVA